MKFLTKSKQIEAWLNSMGITGFGVSDYAINSDGVVDVDGHVDLALKLGNLTALPVRFGKVSGCFSCNYNNLTTLEGCPQEIGIGFSCWDNNLTNLDGCPRRTGGLFDCSYNRLTSLEGGPEEVSELDCSHNLLTSLKGYPLAGWFYCQHNPIETLDGIPEDVVTQVVGIDTVTILKRDRERRAMAGKVLDAAPGQSTLTVRLDIV